MYPFQLGNSVLDNQMVCSSLGINMSPTLSIPLLPVVLCAELKPHVLFPCPLTSLGVTIVQLMLRQLS